MLKSKIVHMSPGVMIAESTKPYFLSGFFLEMGTRPYGLIASEGRFPHGLGPAGHVLSFFAFRAGVQEDGAAFTRAHDVNIARATVSFILLVG
jgi:hypothetical protein